MIHGVLRGAAGHSNDLSLSGSLFQIVCRIAKFKNLVKGGLLDVCKA